MFQNIQKILNRTKSNHINARQTKHISLYKECGRQLLIVKMQTTTRELQIKHNAK